MSIIKNWKGNYYRCHFILSTELFANYTRKVVPIKKRARSFPIFVIQLISLSSSLSCCVWFLLDERTISDVDLIEMTLNGGMWHLSIPRSPSRLLMDFNTGW